MSGLKPHHLAIIADWRDGDGLTIAEFARRHGYTRGGMGKLLRRAGKTVPTPRRGPPRTGLRDRAKGAEIVVLREAGHSYAEIGFSSRLSGERVRRIIQMMGRLDLGNVGVGRRARAGRIARIQWACAGGCGATRMMRPHEYSRRPARCVPCARAARTHLPQHIPEIVRRRAAGETWSSIAATYSHANGGGIANLVRRWSAETGADVSCLFRGHSKRLSHPTPDQPGEARG